MALFRNKRAIELSVKFIVMLIIALTVFGFGMRFMMQFFVGAKGMQMQLDRQTKARIEELLSSGERVAIPLKKRTLIRGKGDTIGVGVLNVIPKEGQEESWNYFFIKINCVGVCEEAPQVTYSPKHKIELNDQEIIKTYFEAMKNTPSGTYIFNVCVTRDLEMGEGRVCDVGLVSDLYDKTLHKVYIAVP